MDEKTAKWEINEGWYPHPGKNKIDKDYFYLDYYQRMDRIL